LTASLALIPEALPFANQFFASCEALLTTTMEACEPLDNAPDNLSDICSPITKLIDSELDEAMTFQATATIPGAGEFSSAAVPTTVGQTSVALSIDGPQATTLKEFATTPVDPGPGEGYLASASISCAPEDNSLAISMSGSDGYTQSGTCNVADGQGDCEMAVPGGAAGVVDTITVQSSGFTYTIVRVF